MNSQKIRILFIDEVPQIGGGGNYLLSLFSFLNKDAYQPFLISPPGPLAKTAASLGVETIDYLFEKRYVSIKIANYEFPLNPYSLSYSLCDAWRFRRIIKDNKIDIIYTNNLDSHLSG